MNTNNKEQTNNNLNIQPFRAVFNYVSRTSLKRPSTYITFAIFFVIVAALCIMPLIFGSPNDGENITPIYLNIATTISMISCCIQSAIRTSFVFIETQQDGIEILLISKPVNRRHIILARLTFLFIFAFVISLINSLLIMISALASPVKLSSSLSISIIFGSFGAQMLTFIVIFALTLIIGLLVGAKTGRMLPTTVFFISLVIGNIVPQIGSMFSKNPITKINQTFTSYVNKKLESGEINETFNLNGKEVSLKYISTNEWNYGNIFQARNGKLALGEIILWNVKPTPTTSSWNNSKTIYLDPSNIEQNPENKKWVDFSFKYLSEALKNKTIHGTDWLIALNYINPVSGIQNITGINSEVINLTFDENLDIYSNYSNIAPSFADGTNYLTDEDNDYYYTTYKSTKMDPPWALAILWTSIVLGLLTWSCLIYQRKDFR